MFEQLTTKSRLYQENHALNCMEIEELRRMCHEETEIAQQLRTYELDAQKGRRTFHDESGKFPDPDDFQRWRVNFKTEVCVGTSTPELTMSWMNEVEMVDL